MLKFFSASSGTVDTRRAIAECLENALGDGKTLDCDLLIIYTAMGHNFRELLEEARKLSPTARIVGCTCAGVIGKEGPNESLRAIAIMAVKGNVEEFGVVGSSYPVHYNAFNFGRSMASELKAGCPEPNMIFFHPSVITMYNAQDIISGIESVFGPDVPVVGGASIDNMKLIKSFAFMDEKILEGGAIMIGFADPSLELISHANHGFDIVGDPLIITKFEDERILELDGKPAWKRWTEKLGLPESSSGSEVLVFAPLATELAPEYHEVYGNEYMVVGCMPLPDKSIWSAKDISGIKHLWLTRRNENKIFDGVERLVTTVLDRCAGRKPVAVFHADCAARGKLFFNRIMKEEIISQLQFPLCQGENIPWFGMYGGAEYTPLAGKNMLHTYTTSLYVLVRKTDNGKPDIIPADTGKLRSSRLFEETRINNLRLKNRFICSALWQGRANFDGSTSPGLISTLLPVARGDIGMIISGMASVSSDGIAVPGQLGVYSDNHIPGLRRMTDFVHRYETPIILQLVHSGLVASPLLTGTVPAGPSELDTPEGPVGREITTDDLARVVTSFCEAAVRAREAGFDGVQVHAAHGWLISQFLSPFFNKRTDSYGGPVENRSKLLLEIIRNIKVRTGQDFAVTVKINCDDFLPGGFKTQEMLKVCQLLEKEGIDAIEISGGTLTAMMAGDIDSSFSPVSKKGVYYHDAALKFKKACKVPLILVGGIRTFDEADDLVRNGTADYIALGRPLIREPDLISKWKSGNLKRSDCLSDSACFRPGLEGKGVQCIHVK